jgi:hypothetical protein
MPQASHLLQRPSLPRGAMPLPCPSEPLHPRTSPCTHTKPAVPLVDAGGAPGTCSQLKWHFLQEVFPDHPLLTPYFIAQISVIVTSPIDLPAGL